MAMAVGALVLTKKDLSRHGQSLASFGWAGRCCGGANAAGRATQGSFHGSVYRICTDNPTQGKGFLMFSVPFVAVGIQLESGFLVGIFVE